MNDDCTVCGYEFNHFFIKGEILPDEVICPICGQDYEVYEWRYVGDEK